MLNPLLLLLLQLLLCICIRRASLTAATLPAATG
jgi:hypothetical protein